MQLELNDLDAFLRKLRIRSDGGSENSLEAAVLVDGGVVMVTLQWSRCRRIDSDATQKVSM